MRAVVASLLDLRIEQVPHFGLFDTTKERAKSKVKSGALWWNVFYYFMYSNGWEYTGYSRLDRDEPNIDDSINGFFYISVPSRTFKGKSHAVVMDAKGVVVHDPSPNKKWLGEKVFPDKLNGVYCFKKRKREDTNSEMTI